MSNIYAPPTWQIDPKAVKRIAVLTATQSWVYPHTDPRVRAPGPGITLPTDEYSRYNLAYLASILLDHNVAALWLLPNGAHPDSSDHPIIAHWPVSAYEAMIYASDYDLTAHEISSGGHLAGVVFQCKSGGIPFGVYAPWVNNAWGIAELLHQVSPDTLVEGLALAAYVMGAQLRFSPSYTGLSVLRDTLRGVDLPQMSDEWARRIEPLRPTYIQWRRKIEVDEFPTLLQTGEMDPWAPEPPLTLYKYDRISSFMASARELPVGDPIPTKEFMPHLPGVYKIRDMSPGLYSPWLADSWEMPGPLRCGVVGEVGEYPPAIYDAPGPDVWAWEPQIRLAVKHNAVFHIEEGYYWPREQRRDFMRDWQQHMWRARYEAESAQHTDHTASKIAQRIIKKASVTTIGRLNQNEGYGVTTKSEAREKGYRIVSREVDDQGTLTGNVTAQMPMGRTDLYLPHVWSTIIANANERLQSLSYAYPGDTVLQYVDAAYMLHQHPEIEQPGRLGKFKLERVMSIPVADLERVNTMSPYDLTVYLAQGEHDTYFFVGGDQEPEDSSHGE